MEVIVCVPLVSSDLALSLIHISIDTDGVAQSATAMKLDSVFRPDIPGEPLERDALLANAKTIGGGYIIVPRVVE